MAQLGRAGGLLRARHGHGHGRVTFIELFFDLVFVFAVTQLSHRLLEHLTLRGAVETLLLFLAVWWVWIFTSWVTNWLDPDRAPVRLLLLGLMLAGLVLSTSLPEAFGERGLTFAISFVLMQVGRSAFMLLAFPPKSPGRRNFQRITAWLACSGLFWIAGGLAHGEARLGLWAVAVLLEYVSPSLGFHVPGLGRSTTADWDVEGGHLAERCALFIIIALGESVLVTGATLGGLEGSPAVLAAFAVAFIGTAAMWWIYFDTGAERGSSKIAASDDPGRVARLAYTYVHLVIVAGIIVAAVADELVLAHPLGHAGGGVLACILGGPALFVLGNLLFKGAIAGRAPLSHLIGLGLLAVLALLAASWPPLGLAGAATLVLMLVAGWEWRSLRGGARQPETAAIS